MAISVSTATRSVLRLVTERTFVARTGLPSDESSLKVILDAIEAARHHAPNGAADTLTERLVASGAEHQAQVSAERLETVEQIMQYCFLCDFSLTVLDGDPLESEALDVVRRFSSRSVWLGHVRIETASDDWRAQVTPDLRGERVLRFRFGPDGQEFFAADTELAGKAGGITTVEYAWDAEGVLDITSEGGGESKLALRPRPQVVQCVEFSDRDAPASISVVPVLYEALDRTAPEIVQELGGLTHAQAAGALSHIALTERFADRALTDREQHLVELACDAIVEHGLVSRFLARPPMFTEAVPSPVEWRYRAQNGILACLQEALAAEAAPTSTEWRSFLTAQWTASESVLRELRDGVRASLQRMEDQIGADGGPGVGTHHLFYAVLSGAAVDTAAFRDSLQRQVTLLTVLNGLKHLDIAVSYRFFTAFQESDELAAYVEVEATVAGCDLNTAEQLRRTFGELVHAAFVGAFRIRFRFAAPQRGNPDAVRLRHPVHRKLITRKRSGRALVPFSGQPDWAYVLDYIRTLEAPVAVTISARAGDYRERGSAPDGTQELTSGLAIGNLSQVGSADAVSAAAALSELVARELGSSHRVRLQVEIASNDPVPESLSSLVGSEVSGGTQYEVAEPDELEPSDERFLVSLAEAIGVFHPPFGSFFSGPGRGPSTSIAVGATTFPLTGAKLGTARRAHAKADRQVPVRLRDADVQRHVYVVGRTGSGKTNLLKGLAAQHVAVPGTGLAVIDPHGDLAKHVFHSVPAGRLEDVHVVDLTDPDLVPVLNPLLRAPGTLERSRMVQDILELIRLRMYHEWAGPRFDELARLALDTLLDEGYPVAPSLVDVPRLFTDEKLRHALIARLHDAELKDRWAFHQRVARTNDYYELIDWAISKFGEISRDATLRAVLSGERQTVDIRQVVRDNGILIVTVPEAVVGRQTAEFVGALVLQELRGALLSRSVSEVANGPFFLYVDEFQKFATSGFEELLAEARKYGVGTVLAHQNLEQLNAFSRYAGSRAEGLSQAILGNAGSMVVFGVGAPDIDRLSGQLGVSPDELSGVARHEAIARLTVDGALTAPFSLRTTRTDMRLDPRRDDEVRAMLLDAGRVQTRESLEAESTARSARLDSVAAGRDTASVSSREVEPRREPSGAGSVREPEDLFEEFLRRRGERSTPPRRKSAALRPESRPGVPKGASPSRASTSASPGSPDSPDDAGRAPSTWSVLVGPVVLLSDVADVLGEPVQFLRGKGERRELLVLRTREGTEVVPKAHFRHREPLPGLEDVLKALKPASWSAWSTAGWLASDHALLGGRSVLDWLHSEDPIEMVLRLASDAAEGMG